MPLKAPRRIRVQAALLATSAAVLAILLLALPTVASADLRFCPPGSGAGQCSEQSGVATDFETERVYVADRGNNRIDVFEADGTFLFAFGWKVNATVPVEALQTCTALTGCQKGSAGTGDGQFSKPRRVAVDNDPASASHHDVYVFDSGNLRVQKFDPSGGFLKKAGSEGTGPGQFEDEVDLVTVAPSGRVYISDMPEFAKKPRVEVFDAELGFLEEFELAHQQRLNAGLAVDSTGDVYAVFNDALGIFKFHPDGTEFGSPYPLVEPDAGTKGLAVGAEDQLFAAQSKGRVDKVKGDFPVITVYKPSGGYLERFGYGLGFGSVIEVGSGVAVVHSGGPGLRHGDVFASLNSGANRVAYVPMPLPGPVVAPLSVEVPVVGNTKATLAAELNPEGSKPTKYHFEYVDQHSFEVEGGFKSPRTKITAEVEVPIKSGTLEQEEMDLFSLHAAVAQVGCTDPVVEIGEGKCLAPETAYRFRVVASNPEGEAEAVEGRFETREPLEVKEAWASEPVTDGARLNARVDPLGLPTSGYFEYVDEEDFEANGFAGAKQVPDVAHGQSPLDFGSGAASVRGVSLEGLVSGRGYRYRLVASDPLLAMPVQGPVRTLRPFAKPVQAPCANDEFRSGVGALLLDCRAFEMVSPLDKNNGDIVPPGEFTTEVPAALDESAVSGEKVSYTTSTAFGDTASAPYSASYIAERGKEGWGSHAIQSPRGRPDVVTTPQINTEFKLFSPDLCQVWQRTLAEPPLTLDAITGYPNIYRRTDQSCGGAPTYEAITTVTPPNVGAEQYDLLELQGTSADGNTAIFVAPDNLAAGAPPQPAGCTSKGVGCELRLYEKRPGQELKLVCFLPGGEPVAPCRAGSGGSGTGNGLEGSLHNAISADGERVYWTGGGKLYLRVGGTQTLAVSVAGEVLSGTSSSTFRGASADGSKAIFLSEKAGVSDLYEYDAQSEATTLVAHEVVGVADMSEDGSHVYFASTAELTVVPNSAGGKAKAGKPNLYLAEGGSVRFIATLASGDPGSVTFSSVATRTIQRMARVSGDGGTLAFITTASPTGYDNTDAGSPEECGEGHPQGICDAELFLYQADANEGKGRLVCVSCNPSGARPVGADISSRVHTGNPFSFFAAGWIPAWENNQYASRVLSANGRRLFFEAADALSPLDTNGVGDVYEWEQAGEGTCKEGSASYVPESGGCVGLVSSGKSVRDSLFLDADPEGRNAFFTTLSSLVPQDPGLIDVYDAREGGGLPPPPSRRVECEGEACQSPAVSPNDQTPASMSFSGPGDLVSGLSPGVAARSVHKTAAQVRSARLSKALKACRRAKMRQHRKGCEAAARKRYALRAKSGAKTSVSGRRGR
jgi:hypothetical protein